MILVHYPSWTSARNAKAWLEEKGVDFEIRHIVKETPTKEEFLEWKQIAGVDKKKFVNTNGKKYKELGLKDTIADMSDSDLFSLIASDGMLVKRPLLIGQDFVLFGFKKLEWEAQSMWLNNENGKEPMTSFQRRYWEVAQCVGNLFLFLLLTGLLFGL